MSQFLYLDSFPRVAKVRGLQVSVLIRYQTYFYFLQSSQYSGNWLQPDIAEVKPSASLNINLWLQI